MSDRVLLKLFYFGQILLETAEGVKFICESPVDIVIPFIISFEELKGVICEKIGSERARNISCILYRYPIQVFGGFVQYQSKYVTDDASMQEMLLMYIENRSQISFIELYVEFEQFEADQNILQEDYNSDSEEEFESNYEFSVPDGDEDQGGRTMCPDVTEVANALANEVPFEEPSFMRVLDLGAMHVPEFPEYMTAEIPMVADGEFVVGMEFSSREAVIKAVKDYTIRRSVDYRVYESEPLTFYAKCTQYGSGCDWLIRVSLISRKYCWVIRRYNGSHTCTTATISQDHSKLDSITIAEAIKPLVEVDPSLKVKSVIAEVQSKFNYTVSYRKAWLAKQRAIEKIFGGWKHRMKPCLYGLRPCVTRNHQLLSILRLCLHIKAMTWWVIFGYCIVYSEVITLVLGHSDIVSQLSRWMVLTCTESIRVVCLWQFPRMETTISFRLRLLLLRERLLMHGIFS
ncbi:uncharacterized protein [Arachis hypogaea]|uniref:uncharacterized protein n=1 Tax=Arachis hypogaea TaxID=3818 RepID=UPI000DEC5941|nr:uncharacterized protein LOC112709016 [Arachis hypogaea]